MDADNCELEPDARSRVLEAVLALRASLVILRQDALQDVAIAIRRSSEAKARSGRAIERGHAALARLQATIRSLA